MDNQAEINSGGRDFKSSPTREHATPAPTKEIDFSQASFKSIQAFIMNPKTPDDDPRLKEAKKARETLLEQAEEADLLGPVDRAIASAVKNASVNDMVTVMDALGGKLEEQARTKPLWNDIFIGLIPAVVEDERRRLQLEVLRDLVTRGDVDMAKRVGDAWALNERRIVALQRQAARADFYTMVNPVTIRDIESETQGSLVEQLEKGKVKTAEEGVRTALSGVLFGDTSDPAGDMIKAMNHLKDLKSIDKEAAVLYEAGAAFAADIALADPTKPESYIKIMSVEIGAWSDALADKGVAAALQDYIKLTAGDTSMISGDVEQGKKDLKRHVKVGQVVRTGDTNLDNTEFWMTQGGQEQAAIRKALSDKLKNAYGYSDLDATYRVAMAEAMLKHSGLPDWAFVGDARGDNRSVNKNSHWITRFPRVFNPYDRMVQQALDTNNEGTFGAFILNHQNLFPGRNPDTGKLENSNEWTDRIVPPIVGLPTYLFLKLGSHGENLYDIIVNNNPGTVTRDMFKKGLGFILEKERRAAWMILYNAVLGKGEGAPKVIEIEEPWFKQLSIDLQETANKLGLLENVVVNNESLFNPDNESILRIGRVLISSRLGLKGDSTLSLDKLNTAIVAEQIRRRPISVQTKKGLIEIFLANDDYAKWVRDSGFTISSSDMSRKDVYFLVSEAIKRDSFAIQNYLHAHYLWSMGEKTAGNNIWKNWQTDYAKLKLHLDIVNPKKVANSIFNLFKPK